MALHDFYSPGERERIARGEFNSTQVQLRELLEGTGARRVEVECAGVGLHQSIRPWLVEKGGRRRSVEVDEACPSAESLREWQALPGRGAWFRSRLWMEMPEGVLHQESDWMREPVINGELMSEQDAAVELRLHPRDPEFIPEWMATKAAAFHKKEEARARRRERDRTRRERKKAEAAQAAQEAETNTSSTASEAAGKASS